ncbi:MAG: hypothetical protein ACLTQI_08785 [Slackia sp.]
MPQARVETWRVAQAIRCARIHGVSQPSPHEARAHAPSSWRYWTRLPRAGHVGIYDRSWYGRVWSSRVRRVCQPCRVEPRLRRNKRIRTPAGSMGRHPAEILGCG